MFIAAGKGIAIGSLVAFPPLALPFNTIAELIVDYKSQPIKKSKIRRVLLNMEKRKLVSLKEVNGELVAAFNEEGIRRILRYKLDELKINKPKKWDQKWRIVIFDIPENKKLARDVLRNRLDQLEFFQLQRSVFIYPFECRREIALLAECYGIKPYVYCIRADYIDNQGMLKKKFGLS